MKMKLPIDKATLVKGGRVLVAVGAGAALAQVGSELVKRASSSVAAFAAKSATNEAIVDAGAGLLGATAGLLIYGKITNPGKAKAYAPLVVGGVLLSAAAPVVAPMITGYVTSAVEKLLPAPGGYYRDRFPGGVAGRDVRPLALGGVAGRDVRPLALGGRPGGVASYDIPARVSAHVPL